MAFKIGDTIADYEIVGRLGAGAVAEVYKVKHRVTGRLEAMKVLHRRGLAGRRVDRFLREIKLQAGLSHPNIAAVRTALEIDGELLMIMEYVEGESLRGILDTQNTELDEALDYALQALSALGYAHQRGVIHRDVTPSNMLITPQGKLKLTDFGLAKAIGDPTLTETGTPLGSLSYMSPEHVRGLGETDQQSDIYSIGAVLYELIVGKPPFDGKNAFELMRAHLEQEPQPPQELVAGLDPELNRTVLRALAKDPRKRFASAQDFRSALSPVRPHLMQPWSRVGSTEAQRQEPDKSLPAVGGTQQEIPSKEPASAAKYPSWWAPALGAALAVVLLFFMVWPGTVEQPPAVEGAPEAIATPSSRISGTASGLDNGGGSTVAGITLPQQDGFRSRNRGAQPTDAANVAVAPGSADAPGSSPRRAGSEGDRNTPTRPEQEPPSRLRAAAGINVARSGDDTLDLTVAGNRPAADARTAAEHSRAVVTETARADPTADLESSGAADWESVREPRLVQSLRVPRLSKLAVSTDGTRLAGAAEDRIVRVWNLRSGQISMQFEGHTAPISALAFSPGGGLLASGDDAGLVKLWDLDSERDLAALKQRGAIHFISFSRDGQWMATGSDDASVGLWKRKGPFATPHWERGLKGPKQVPVVGAFSPKGSHVVTASNDSVLRVWPVVGDGESRRVTGLEGGFAELTYSPDGRWLAVAGGRSLTIWDATHYEQVRQVDIPAGTHAVAFTPDGLCLVATATFRTLVLWEATSGSKLGVLDTDIRVQSMTMTLSAERLVVADANGGLRIWDIPAPDASVLRSQATPAPSLQSATTAPGQRDGSRPGLVRRVVDLFR
jgi:serine/threonine-protein kinase